MRAYSYMILQRPKTALLLMLALTAVCASRLPYFELDVSSEALTLEKDPALRTYDGLRLVFGSDDYVIIAYKAKDVFSDDDVALISDLTRDLKAIQGVDTVMSIASERLFRSPAGKSGVMGLMLGDPVTLDSPGCDRELARRELTTSRVYSGNLVSPDSTRTAMLVYLLQKSDSHDFERRIYLMDWLLDRDGSLRRPLFAGGIKPAVEKVGGAGVLVFRKGVRDGGIPEWARLEDWLHAAGSPVSAYADGAVIVDESKGAASRVEEDLRKMRSNLDHGEAARMKQSRAKTRVIYQRMIDERRDQRVRVLGDIRALLASYSGRGRTFYSSGIPLIFVDMMTYVKRDISLFGMLVVAFIFATMAVVFRKARWVVLPMLAAAMTVVILMGAMIATGVKTTVITSNMSSLLLILTMSHSIHIAVRYEEERALDPHGGRGDRIIRTVSHIGVPCFYIAATTAVGFLSLAISGIRPVTEFGEFMAAGVMLAWAVSFVVVPAGLMAWPVRDRSRTARKASGGGMKALGLMTAKARFAIAAATAAVVAASIAGITRLDVETVFIDYFHSDTEIHRGLKFIDGELGGTSSLEVVLTAPEEDHFTKWENIEPLQKIERYLSSYDPDKVGKIISISTMMHELDDVLVANGMPHPPGAQRHDAGLLLGILAGMGAEEFGSNRAAVYSYIDPTFRIARVFIRIRESAEGLNRNRLISDLRVFLASDVERPGLKVEMTGVFLLYANMLRSLFGGQVKTSLMVFIAIFAMMMMLFRSWRMALLALLPNTVPIMVVLGTMGWLNVNLDMNNIMVASVSMGIAVDDTLHYIFRFRHEFEVEGDYMKALFRSNDTIGWAMLFTSVVIIAGFVVLGLSNFIPTQNFGIFTTIAMVVAMPAAIVLLPALILITRPFGRESCRAA